MYLTIAEMVPAPVICIRWHYQSRIGEFRLDICAEPVRRVKGVGRDKGAASSIQAIDKPGSVCNRTTMFGFKHYGYCHVVRIGQSQLGRESRTGCRYVATNGDIICIERQGA